MTVYRYRAYHDDSKTAQGGCVLTIAPVAPRVAPEANLKTADTALCFQTILLIGSAVSLAASRILRDQLAGDACVQTFPVRSILQTKTMIGAVSFVALIYYAFEAQYVFQRAESPAGCLSAKAELIAAMLALVVSGLRLYSLSILNRNGDSLPETLEDAELMLE